MSVFQVVVLNAVLIAIYAGLFGYVALALADDRRWRRDY